MVRVPAVCNTPAERDGWTERYGERSWLHGAGRPIEAFVRAHRRRLQVESGQAKSITGLAEQEGLTDAYVCRLLPLTGLAPGILEAILDGRQPNELRLAESLGNGPVAGEEQR
jgi:hypothetical protein